MVEAAAERPARACRDSSQAACACQLWQHQMGLGVAHVSWQQQQLSGPRQVHVSCCRGSSLCKPTAVAAERPGNGPHELTAAEWPLQARSGPHVPGAVAPERSGRSLCEPTETTTEQPGSGPCAATMVVPEGPGNDPSEPAEVATKRPRSNRRAPTVAATERPGVARRSWQYRWRSGPGLAALTAAAQKLSLVHSSPG